jgi:hypothetical protein
MMLGEWTSKIGNQPYLIGMEVAKFIISRDFSFYKDKLHLYSSICIKTKLMLQSIITALIVLIAIYFVLKPLFSKKKSESACNTCSSRMSHFGSIQEQRCRREPLKTDQIIKTLNISGRILKN